jgi:ATP-dependent Clp protease ATP-binding subunit ClpA
MDQFSEEHPAGPVPDLAAPAQRTVQTADDIDVPFTPAARRVLDRCVDALADGQDEVLADSLLRAIAETPESAAAQLIEEHGQSADDLLAALQVLLREGAADQEPTSSPRLERLVIRAKREAFRHSHREVSTLHLLMALLRERATDRVLGSKT